MDHNAFTRIVKQESVWEKGLVLNGAGGSASTFLPTRIAFVVV